MNWMKSNSNLAFVISFVILIGFPLLFFIISLITGHWSYLLYAIVPSLVAGLTGLNAAKKTIKKTKNCLEI